MFPHAAQSRPANAEGGDVSKQHIVFGLYLLSNLLFIAGSLVGMLMKDKT